MSSVAPTMQAFFTERMVRQRQASPQTIAAYRDTFRLLIGFVQRQSGKAPSDLTFDDVNAVVISAFLDHLQADRQNSTRTRNARLGAIRSLFRYAALRHPEHAALIQQVLAIPQKRFEKAIVSFLTPSEVDALIGAPDQSTWEGRRDRAMMLLAVQSGLRVSELVGLNCSDVTLGTGAHVRCIGKGRKQRAIPLTESTQLVLRTWLSERTGRNEDPLFPTRIGRRLSKDAVERRVNTHAATATLRCPSLVGKRLSPHVLRHSAAMSLLRAGVDTSVIALWLGHFSGVPDLCESVARNRLFRSDCHTLWILCVTCTTVSDIRELLASATRHVDRYPRLLDRRRRRLVPGSGCGCLSSTPSARR